MQLTLNLLATGHAEVLEYYRRAAQHWAEIWARPGAHDPRVLARLLPTEQDWFETFCGGVPLGREIMGLAALANLYSPRQCGFDAQTDQARCLLEAFALSRCAAAVKESVQLASFLYGMRSDKPDTQ